MDEARIETQVGDELYGEVDALINIIDNARHAAWAHGPKLEPVRQALAAVPESVRAGYEARKWARHVAAGGTEPTSVRVGRANPLREELSRGGAS